PAALAAKGRPSLVDKGSLIQPSLASQGTLVGKSTTNLACLAPEASLVGKSTPIPAETTHNWGFDLK
ncbi:hypothetical protein, partial [Paenibacillus graminis]|uniref:hypothetical protein n=1 Tax=Paenibacillus graminis TaxID=189425 RepID=UPI001EE1975D